LSDAAIARTIDALEVCADKIYRRQTAHVRCVATQACRAAANGEAFLNQARQRTGLTFEIITPEEEAKLAVLGSLDLADPSFDVALVVDVGGGSTELCWIDAPAAARAAEARSAAPPPILAWASLPVGVVTLAERFREGAAQDWRDAMRTHVRNVVGGFRGADILKPAFQNGRGHVIGASGTVTSLAGVHMRLTRYDRAAVDGLWMNMSDAHAAAAELGAMSQAERAAHPCIGPQRADLVLAGAAILEAIDAEWPSVRMRVADRGLREGVLRMMMQEQGVA
jgi:exopolyphosphatase/guanosine-5'-triphosphate,3'-diphosphate pyrophosphatase